MNKEKANNEVQGEKTIPCITLIGMPGSGKSTVGESLAKHLSWAFMDTDYLLEALYACRLQDVVDSLGKESFLDTEELMILSLKAQRTVIATGGSVVYRPQAMGHLSSMGALVYIKTGLPCLLERISLKPERGIAIAPGQSLEDLYRERIKLYEHYADLVCDSEKLSPAECADFIAKSISHGLLEKAKLRMGKVLHHHD